MEILVGRVSWAEERTAQDPRSGASPRCQVRRLMVALWIAYCVVWYKASCSGGGWMVKVLEEVAVDFAQGVMGNPYNTSSKGATLSELGFYKITLDALCRIEFGCESKSGGTETGWETIALIQTKANAQWD